MLNNPGYDSHMILLRIVLAELDLDGTFNFYRKVPCPFYPIVSLPTNHALDCPRQVA